MSKDKKNKAGTQVPQGQFVFGKQNYQLMLIGLAVIILGFVLMYGKEGDIYDFRTNVPADQTKQGALHWIQRSPP